jgi:predicted nuclease of predicted toxin-antitoxin system
LAERIRFHLDEHIDPAIARGLRRHGVDVTTTVEARLLSRQDQDQWEYARESRRVLFTHDADFLRMADQDTDHAGIVYCHRTAHSLGETIRRLILIYEVLSANEIVGRVQFL